MAFYCELYKDLMPALVFGKSDQQHCIARDNCFVYYKSIEILSRSSMVNSEVNIRSGQNSISSKLYGLHACLNLKIHLKIN